jgi:hypothetical protein
MELNLWEGGFPYTEGWAEYDPNTAYSNLGAGTFSLSPEPGSLLLFGTGLFGLAGLLLRRRGRAGLALNS